MHRVAALVRRTIIRLSLVPLGARVSVGISGGPDSVALVFLLAELAARGDLQLVGLAHLNHGIRGAASDRDEHFCRGLAGQMGLPFDVERVDVPALAAGSRRSVEDAARLARYGFLVRSAERLGADRVAVGHTRDDQAETFLLQLIRGAGPRGLAGIHPQVGLVVRPLIETPRQTLRDYLAERGLPFVIDETNEDRRIARNRVRLELLPYLEQAFSPAIARILSREATIARIDADFLEREARTALERLVADTADGLELEAAALEALPPALGWRVTREILRRVGAGRFVGFDLVQGVLAMVRRGPSPRTLQVPGATVSWREGRLWLRPAGRVPAGPPGTNYFRVSLSIPGEAILPGLDRAVSADRASWPKGDSPAGPPRASSPDMAVVDAALVSSVLAVRTRRPGDRFRPLGMTGRKKLHDFFVDRRVPRDQRDRVPIVVDDADRIVWVAGHTIAEDFRVTERTAAVVILNVHEHWSGRA